MKKRIAASGLAFWGAISVPVMAAEALAADSPWLTGDWAGKRNELSEQGFIFGLFYVNELAANVKGGYDQRTALVTSDQTTALFNYDLSKKMGVDGEFSLVLTNRNNHQLLSNTRLNDPRTGTLPNLSQEVWGFGSVTRLTRLTYKQNFFDKKLTVRVGKMTPTEEYFPSTCEFQSLVNCGTVPGISNIWYGWPISTWAISTTYHITPDWYIKVGAYQQSPLTTRNERRMSLSTRGSEGQIYPILLGWRPHWGERKLAGNYFIGAYYSNVDAPDVAAGAAGGMEASNPAAGFKSHHGKYAAWAFFEQQLTGPGGDSKQGLRVFVNAEINDKATSVLHYGYGAGPLLQWSFRQSSG
ncbi:porin [Pseudomonas psychrotolerans]|nr:porin [Pseudomonas psychrotolerans]